MKAFYGALAVLLSLIMVFCMGLSCYAAPEIDETDPEFQYKSYITDFLKDDIKATGKTQDELLDAKALELGIKSERAFELELECGLHPVIYTMDERPLPETTVATDATEETLVTEPTEVETQPSDSEQSDPAEATEETEPSEAVTTSVVAEETESTPPAEGDTGTTPPLELYYDMGDVNMDGRLNIKDATAIQKFVAKLEHFDNIQLYLADYNSDTQVNVKDATHIQKKLANLI